jgi:hypothetical protein
MTTRACIHVLAPIIMCNCVLQNHLRALRGSPVETGRNLFEAGHQAYLGMQVTDSPTLL